MIILFIYIMGSIIGIGECDKKLKYIFLFSLFLILTNSLFGFYFNDNFGILQIFKTDIQLSLYKHKVIHEFFRNIGIIIISFIFFEYQTKIFSKDSDKEENKKNNSNANKQSKPISSKIVLIHNKPTNYLRNYGASPFYIIFIITSWIICNYLIDLFYKFGLRDLDYWMLELIIVTYLNKKMFNLTIYKHQYFAIFFNTIVCGLLKLTSFLISFINDNKDKLEYSKNKWLIPIGIISYILIMSLRSYVNTRIKWLMDSKYISEIKLLLIYGIFGAFFSLIICIISTFIKCTSQNSNICNVNLTNSSDYYFESISIYYETLSNTNGAKEIIYEIIVNFLGVITNFFYFFYYILIIKDLTPVHIIFSNSMYYFCFQIIIFIYSTFEKKNIFDDENSENSWKTIKHYIDIIEDFIAIIGFVIYLELIEIKIFELNYNLKKNIRTRSIADFSNINNNNDDEQSQDIELSFN